jgi:hypothetical protein
MLVDQIVPKGVQLRHGWSDLREDFRLLCSGVLDFASFRSGYQRHNDAVEWIVRDKTGKLKAVRRTHNLRTTQGRDQWQRVLMSGDVAALNGLTGTATSTTATTLTNTGAAFPTATSAAGNAGLQGKKIIAGSVYGNIVSNTATVITVDQWYAIPVTGAAGATPSGTSSYVILPGSGFGAWIGLSTDTTTPAAGDTCNSSTGLFLNEQTGSGLARTYVAATFPSAGEYQFANTFTYTGSTSVTIAKGVICNTKAVAGTLLLFETLASATATVNASGDTIALTWTISL